MADDFEDLSDELRRYVAAHNLPSMSADELAAEVSAVLDGERSHFVAAPDSDERKSELTAAHSWLKDFCERWEGRETCVREGHQDTGRGVCADCGMILLDSKYL